MRYNALTGMDLPFPQTHDLGRLCGNSGDEASFWAGMKKALEGALDYVYPVHPSHPITPPSYPSADSQRPKSVAIRTRKYPIGDFLI
jgi:hypothetical protein